MENNSQDRQKHPLTKGWKQPIPTAIYQFFEEDYLALNTFLHLLLHARHEDMAHPQMIEGKKLFQLSKGQALFGKKKYAAYLHCSPAGAHKVLERLKDRYQLVDTEPTPNFTIVTIINYDDLVRFWTASEPEESTRSTVSSTNKNDTTKTTVKSGDGNRHLDELKKLCSICETVFECEKRITPAAFRLYQERRGVFSAEEMQSAFKNLLNEPDLFKIKTNKSRSLEWWLSSDGRIEDMLNCHLNKFPKKS